MFEVPRKSRTTFRYFSSVAKFEFLIYDRIKWKNGPSLIFLGVYKISVIILIDSWELDNLNSSNFQWNAAQTSFVAILKYGVTYLSNRLSESCWLRHIFVRCPLLSPVVIPNHNFLLLASLDTSADVVACYTREGRAFFSTARHLSAARKNVPRR